MKLICNFFPLVFLTVDFRTIYADSQNENFTSVINPSDYSYEEGSDDTMNAVSTTLPTIRFTRLPVRVRPATPSTYSRSYRHRPENNDPINFGHLNANLYNDHMYGNILHRAQVNKQFREQNLKNTHVFEHIYSHLKKHKEHIERIDKRIDDLTKTTNERFLKLEKHVNTMFEKHKQTMIEMDKEIKDLQTDLVTEVQNLNSKVEDGDRELHHKIHVLQAASQSLIEGLIKILPVEVDHEELRKLTDHYETLIT